MTHLVDVGYDHVSSPANLERTAIETGHDGAADRRHFEEQFSGGRGGVVVGQPMQQRAGFHRLEQVLTRHLTRGSNENTNGLLRQYLPQGTDLSNHTAAELEVIQTSLNNRPRKTLEYMTPSEAYTQVLAATG